MIQCELCGATITKYKMDLGDTVMLKVEDKIHYICDECSFNIAAQRINR